MLKSVALHASTQLLHTTTCKTADGGSCLRQKNPYPLPGGMLPPQAMDIDIVEAGWRLLSGRQSTSQLQIIAVSWLEALLSVRERPCNLEAIAVHEDACQDALLCQAPFRHGTETTQRKTSNHPSAPRVGALKPLSRIEAILDRWCSNEYRIWHARSEMPTVAQCAAFVLELIPRCGQLKPELGCAH